MDLNNTGMKIYRATKQDVGMITQLFRDTIQNVNSKTYSINFIYNRKYKMKKIKLITFALLAFNTLSYAQQDINLTKYVDPFIGTEGEGNTFPGATLPFGMVKLGPDCGDLTSNSGYMPEGDIKGFSHIHVSGTGGGPKYGNVLVMPVTGKINLQDRSSARENETAEVGMYKVTLSMHDIDVRLTSSHSVGFHQYTFPASDDSKILIDAGSFLTTSWCDGCIEEQELVGCEIEIVNDTLIEGYTRVRRGWNTGDAYTVYFSAHFDEPAVSFGTWKKDQLLPGQKVQFDSGERAGAWFGFNTEKDQTIQVKVGISFLGRLKARENIKNEIPHWSFEAVYSNSVNVWNEILGKINVETDDEDLKTIFYTGLYHSILQPTDRTGENPLWQSDKPYYDDFYAIWDTYRVTHPLFMFLCPERQTGIINAMLDIYEQEGYMPDARSGNFTGRTQGGSNSDVLIADAFVKGLKGIDYEKALEAMITNAELDPGGAHQLKGRGGLTEYNSLGYVSTNHERAGSRTVEYAYNDYCIYQVAKGLGKKHIAAKYLERSGNWKNLFKPMEDHGAMGFIMPKKANGEWDEEYRGRKWNNDIREWVEADFSVHIHGTWPDFFYEADSWEYSFYVPHNVPELITVCGGKDAFVARLDTFFKHGYYNVGNEPSFLTPSLYNFAGRQDKSNETIREIIKKHYTTARDGIPGNDDSGSMSSWAAFNLMGIYPNAGQDYYLITAPHFNKVTINMGDDTHLVIKTKDLSKDNIYIQKVLFNGKQLTRSWFSHTEIMHGGTLEFFMGNKPNNHWEKISPEKSE